jgi:hypothetical protein
MQHANRCERPSNTFRGFSSIALNRDVLLNILGRRLKNVST